MKRVTVGFIPLTDAAPIIAARACGFAAEAGLDLELVREVSWANIRDKLSVGLFDAAHMLAPLALAGTLGIGHVRVPIAAPITLALNSNAITLATAFLDEVGEMPDDPVAAQAEVRHFIRFDVPGAVRPHFGRAAWLYAQMVRWGQARFTAADLDRVRAFADASLFDRVTGLGGAAAEDGDPVASHLDPPFDPQAIEAYLAGFDGRGLARRRI